MTDVLKESITNSLMNIDPTTIKKPKDIDWDDYFS